MNIGFVVHHFDATDGTGGYAVELVNRLAKDHRVTLYAAAIRSQVPDGVSVVRVRALGVSAYARILSFPGAFGAIRGKHDIVHAQGWVTGSADVMTTHIVLDAWREAARSAGVESRPGERLFGGFVAARERSLVQRAGIVITPSERAAADVARCYRRTSGVITVHHGFPTARPLPTSAASRIALGLPPEAFVALYAGDARKGLGRAIGALQKATEVHLLVASRSDPSTYIAIAHTLGVWKRVHWAGGLDDMLPAYSAADALLHPTIYDTFAMVVAEAMSYGIPVILSREAGIAELVTHRKSGWILKSDCSDIADALTALSANRSMGLQLAREALRTAENRTWDKVTSETLCAYKRVPRVAQQGRTG